MIGGIPDNGQRDWPLYPFSWLKRKMTSLLLSQIADWIRHAAQQIWHSVRPHSSSGEIVGMAVDLSRFPRDLVIENAVLRHQVSKVIKISVRAANMNAVAERFVGSSPVQKRRSVSMPMLRKRESGTDPPIGSLGYERQ
jgi:hypothetical protein